MRGLILPLQLGLSSLFGLVLIGLSVAFNKGVILISATAGM